MMKRRRLIVGLLLLGFFQGKTQTPVERPNILWIVSEENNTALIGCYGNPYATTPNIDQSAKQGGFRK